MRSIILASSSPRRKELMTAMGLQFDVLPSDYDEQLDHSRSASAVAIELALGKAMAIARQHPTAIVIGSDTIPTIHGRQLEKPIDRDDARQTLTMLSGTFNDVTTSLVVLCLEAGYEYSGADTTRVYFKPYDAAAIETYLDTGDYADKAGAYGIQSGAAPLIDHTEGNYDTIIGLPTTLLAPALQTFGYRVEPLKLVPPL